LDRPFEVRKTEIIGAPTVSEQGLEFEWRGTYSQPGCPDFVFGGLERATFEGDRSRLLEDEMKDGTDTKIQAWLAKYFG
jgi:hypothetical protein